MKTRWERIEQILFVLYLLLMLWLLFGQRAGAIVWDEYAQSLKENCNLIPFRTIESYLRLVASASSLALRRHAFINLAGNVIMFLPLGFFLPALWSSQRRLPTLLLTVTVVIVCVEILQLVSLLGSADVDDLILNLLGAAFGWLIFRLTARWRESGDK